jgi:hypothetical protein
MRANGRRKCFFLLSCSCRLLFPIIALLAQRKEGWYKSVFVSSLRSVLFSTLLQLESSYANLFLPLPVLRLLRLGEIEEVVRNATSARRNVHVLENDSDAVERAPIDKARQGGGIVDGVIDAGTEGSGEVKARKLEGGRVESWTEASDLAEEGRVQSRGQSTGEDSDVGLRLCQVGEAATELPVVDVAQEQTRLRYLMLSKVRNNEELAEQARLDGRCSTRGGVCEDFERWEVCLGGEVRVKVAMAEYVYQRELRDVA